MDLSPYVSSENSLLSESSFVSAKSSASNGHRLEWIDNMGTSISPSDTGYVNVSTFRV